METKKLVINDKIYAYYEIFGSRLFIKVLIQLFDNPSDSENYLIYLIQLIEKRKFYATAYLNIQS